MENNNNINLSQGSDAQPSQKDQPLPPLETLPKAEHLDESIENKSSNISDQNQTLNKENQPHVSESKQQPQNDQATEDLQQEQQLLALALKRSLKDYQKPISPLLSELCIRSIVKNFQSKSILIHSKSRISTNKYAIEISKRSI